MTTFEDFEKEWRERPPDTHVRLERWLADTLPIRHLYMDTSTRLVLMDNGVCTIGRLRYLLSRRLEELLAMRGIGPKRVDWARDALAQWDEETAL